MPSAFCFESNLYKIWNWNPRFRNPRMWLDLGQREKGRERKRRYRERVKVVSVYAAVCFWEYDEVIFPLIVRIKWYPDTLITVPISEGSIKRIKIGYVSTWNKSPFPQNVYFQIILRKQKVIPQRYRVYVRQDCGSPASIALSLSK